MKVKALLLGKMQRKHLKQSTTTTTKLTCSFLFTVRKITPWQEQEGPCLPVYPPQEMLSL